MLTLTVPYTEFWDEKNERFIYVKEQSLQLEHSLVSLSKWEAEYEKPFLSKESKTVPEMRDYVKFMTLTHNVNETVYLALNQKHYDDINRYIERPMTATTFRKDASQRPNREQITAELIYYWMTVYNIPFECRKWHLNRLLTLVRVCDVKSRPQKKMSRQEILSRNAALNEARRKKYNTKG